jgi:hypothetical protein
MSTASRGGSSVTAFLAFATLVTIAILAPLTSGALEYSRARTTIWITLALAAPAVAIMVRCFRSCPVTPAWRGWWSFGLAAFLLHLWYGFIVVFDADFGAVLTSQGMLVGSSNFVLATVWSCSVAAAWLLPVTGWTRWLHALATALFVLSAVVSTVLFGSLASKLVGCLFVLILLAAAAARVFVPQTSRSQG